MPQLPRNYADAARESIATYQRQLRTIARLIETLPESFGTTEERQLIEDGLALLADAKGESIRVLANALGADDDSFTTLATIDDHADVRDPDEERAAYQGPTAYQLYEQTGDERLRSTM